MQSGTINPGETKPRKAMLFSTSHYTSVMIIPLTFVQVE
jgi:hypothetical protein